MSFGPATPQSLRAVEDFREARRKAKIESITNALLGRRTHLLSYDMVRSQLRGIESSRRALGDVPLDRIVGSVGRYTDFSRSFLPQMESDRDRWMQVRMGIDSMKGLPPIEVYKVGEVFFILDGHHRVSVARELGMKSVEGYIIPVQTRVPLSPGDSPDALIIKAEYTEFLSRTRLDERYAGLDLLVSAPGQYQKLFEHIAVHQYFLGQQGQAVSEPDAAASWYESVYQPIVELVRSRNLLRDFPGRTETDLYLWIMEYRHQLSQGGIGWEVAPEKAASSLAQRFSPRRRAARITSRLARMVVPEPLVGGPPPGAWRSEHQHPRRGDHLFDDLLVSITGDAEGQSAVHMAVEVARREGARLTGLHALDAQTGADDSAVRALEADFLRRCGDAGVLGRVLLDGGRASELLCRHSPWVDLVVFNLKHPPPQQFLKRLRSGTRMLIRRASSPLFAVPNAPFRLNSALLAYGPGRKAEEALFVAAYLAGRWNIPLTVLTVKTPALGDAPPPGQRARAYLEEQGIQASYIEETGHSARAVALNAEDCRADFIIMGGYESGPLRESVFGSTVDFVLRSVRRPVLICQ